jgi:hypothetical protein
VWNKISHPEESVLGNRLLRKIIGPRKDGGIGNRESYKRVFFIIS